MRHLYRLPLIGAWLYCRRECGETLQRDGAVIAVYTCNRCKAVS